MSDDPRYAVVNTLHAQGYPPITTQQAASAARALIRRFGRTKDACALRTAPMPTFTLERWQRKAQRARNAIRKIERRIHARLRNNTPRKSS